METSRPWLLHLQLRELRKRRQKDHQSQKARQPAVKQSLLEMAELNKVISLDMLTRKGHLTGSHP